MFIVRALTMRDREVPALNYVLETAFEAFVRIEKERTYALAQ